MAQIKQLKDAISWSSSITNREMILDRLIADNEKEIERQGKDNSFDIEEETVINV